ncbi:MAG: hypothetical protein KF746_04355 [Chitinophagaceae bacterium]|nr:hypothetical protein [Chitinophagaceae bacterium]
MHTGKRYTPLEFFTWTLKDTMIMLVLVAVPTMLYEVFGWTFLAIPWQPVGILGTALAFIVGFKNNASYGRIWEARQIYGAIINNSRSFAYILRDTAGGKQDETVKRMFRRHFAWLTALRFQLREQRNWENMQRQSNKRFQISSYTVPEWESDLQEELKKYLPEAELQYILSKKNRATQLTALQSESLAELNKNGIIKDFQWKALQEVVTRLTDDQGKAERIKNFPYPRNFASMATYLMFIFVVLAPFGLLEPMDKLGDGTFMEGYTIWFNILLSSVVCWVFHTLDVVGESAVNPFEGGANDIPVTQISRMIEIDMRDMLDEKELPEPIVAKNNILM